MSIEQGSWRLRQIREIQANATAELLRLIGEHRTQRTDLETGVPQIDLLEEFDRVHGPNPVKSLDEIAKAVNEAATRLQDFHRTDDPKTTHYSPRVEYTQGLIASLTRATMKGSAGLVTDPDARVSIEENKPVIIELLEDVRADKILIDAGRGYGEGFISQHPNWSYCLEGSIAGYEWALGLRPDLGIGALTRTDSLPQPPAAPTAETQV